MLSGVGVTDSRLGRVMEYDEKFPLSFAVLPRKIGTTRLITLRQISNKPVEINYTERVRTFNAVWFEIQTGSFNRPTKLRVRHPIVMYE